MTDSDQLGVLETVMANSNDIKSSKKEKNTLKIDKKPPKKEKNTPNGVVNKGGRPKGAYKDNPVEQEYIISRLIFALRLDVNDNKVCLNDVDERTIAYIIRMIEDIKKCYTHSNWRFIKHSDPRDYWWILVKKVFEASGYKIIRYDTTEEVGKRAKILRSYYTFTKKVKRASKIPKKT